MPIDAANARTSNAHSAPTACGPATPTFGRSRSAAWSGSSRARRRVGEEQGQPPRAVVQPLRRAHARRSTPSAATTRASSPASTGCASAAARRRRAVRPRRGGCAPGPRRIAARSRARARPAAGLEPGVAAAERRVAGERQFAAGVKMRSAWSAPGSDGGVTKVVSESCVQRAKRCIVASSRPVPSRTTASGLPRQDSAEKTSTCAKGRPLTTRAPSSPRAPFRPARRCRSICAALAVT